MDTFFEQIIVRKPRTVETVLKIIFFIVAGLTILLMLFIVFFRLAGSFSSLFIILAFIFGIATYFAFNSLNVEYEYSVTNGYFDIDKIIGKRKRRRMISTACSNFEEFGLYNENRQRLDNRKFDTKVLAANLKEDELYYAVVHDKDKGSVLIVIQPDDRVKGALKKFISRQVQKDVFGRN